MGKSKIEWTDYSWNPVTGCTPISPGCVNCYARRMANRLRGRCGYPIDKPFRVILHHKRLKEPLHWREPSMIFVCSMGDLFHEDVPTTFIDAILGVIAICSQHTFIALTKRPENIESKLYGITKTHLYRYLGSGDYLPNLWLGVTVESPDYLWRVDILRQIPAAVRFISYEPALADLGRVNLDGISWVICGGETGPGARPMHPDWVKDLCDQCVSAEVPFFFKQWGEWFPRDQWEYNPELVLPDDSEAYYNSSHTYVFEAPEGLCPVHRVGRHAAGHLLDGQEWRQFPKTKIR